MLQNFENVLHISHVNRTSVASGHMGVLVYAWILKMITVCICLPAGLFTCLSICLYCLPSCTVIYVTACLPTCLLADIRNCVSAGLIVELLLDVR